MPRGVDGRLATAALLASLRNEELRHIYYRAAMGAATEQVARNSSQTPGAFLSRLPLWLVAFSIVATAGLLQFASVDWNRPLSIYDEVPHIDYTIRLADGQATTWDDVYSQRTLGLAECLETASTDPQCIGEKLRDPQSRWPNGYSYEAHQAPLGYLPFALVELTIVDDQADHFSQIKRLRSANLLLWIAFAGAWALLVTQATQHRLATAAASMVVGVNPLVVDRFTYVTNDGAAIIVATAAAAWLLFRLRAGRTSGAWRWLLPSLLFGAALGLTKPTGLIVLVPLALAALVSHVIAHRPRAPVTWWLSVALMTVSGVIASTLYQTFVDARSTLDFETVLSVILPRGSLGLVDASFLRIGDVSELVTGSGARTAQEAYDWGVGWPSIFVLLFALVGAAAFLISLSLRTTALDRLPELDSRALGYSVLVAFLVMLTVHPALHYVRGEFLMPFTAARFLTTIVPIAGLATLPTFHRFRFWAIVMVPAGLVVAVLSGPWSHVVDNARIVLSTVGL